MSDAAEAAVAAPEPSVAPDAQQQAPVQPPQPIESRGPQPELVQEPKPAEADEQGKKDEPKRPATVSEALKKASEKATEKAAEKKVAEGKEAEKKDAAKAEDDKKPEPVKAEEKTRDETGKFTAKEGDKPQTPEQQQAAKDSPYRAPPDRFKSDQAAAAEWEKAPEAVRAATHRVVKELEQGIQKYKADADEYAELGEYRELAKKYNTNIKTALDNYVGIEQQLAKDPIAGLEKVVSNLGLKRQDGSPVTLRDIAGYILGQKPEDVASRQDAVIQSLNKKIDQLTQQIGGVSKSIEGQQTQAVAGVIAEFERDHPRLRELEADVQFFLESGKVEKSLPIKERLSEAYKLAERLNPGPQQAFAPPAQTRIASDPQAEAQTLIDKGSKSVSGAPSGDEPGKRSPSSSIRESLRRAASAAA